VIGGRWWEVVGGGGRRWWEVVGGGRRWEVVGDKSYSKIIFKV
jgi:hypothetical protein